MQDTNRADTETRAYMPHDRTHSDRFHWKFVNADISPLSLQHLADEYWRSNTNAVRGSAGIKCRTGIRVSAARRSEKVSLTRCNPAVHLHPHLKNFIIDVEVSDVALMLFRTLPVQKIWLGAPPSNHKTWDNLRIIVM